MLSDDIKTLEPNKTWEILNLSLGLFLMERNEFTKSIEELF